MDADFRTSGGAAEPRERGAEGAHKHGVRNLRRVCGRLLLLVSGRFAARAGRWIAINAYF